METRKKNSFKKLVPKNKIINFVTAVINTLICLLLFSNQSLIAQVTITGLVMDQNMQPLPFASVALLQPADSGLVSGTITSDQGFFSLNAKAGRYLLKVSNVGFQTSRLMVELRQGMKAIQTDTIYLKELSHQLDEVVVRAQKPFFEKKIDRIDINVQKGITTAGNTVLEILSKSPGVAVDRQNNSIAMNGKKGVLIMVNGKESHLPMDAMVQLLDGMSAANIEKIELITSPPAKYNAEGNGGIINILTKRSQDKGLNGNIGLYAGFKKHGILGTSLNLNHRGNHLNAFVNYSYRYERNNHEWSNKRFLMTDDFESSNYSSSNRDPVVTVQDLRTGAEYKFNDNTTLSVLMGGYIRKWDMKARTVNYNNFHPDSTLITNMSIKEINKWQNVSSSVDITHHFNNSMDISLSYDYLYYRDDNPSVYVNQTTLNSSPDTKSETMRVEKKTPIHFNISGLDYTYKIDTSLTMETGVKVTLSRFNNNVTAFNSEFEDLEIDPQNSNQSSLDEKVLAAYWTWKWSMNLKLNLVGGIRYEHTSTLMKTSTQKKLINRKFGNFFPALFVTYDINKENKIQITYNRRITRPTFNDMAPFVFFIGPNTFVSGNLALKPAVMNGVDLSYRLKQFWFTLRYSHSDNEIAFLQPEINTETNIQIFRSQNMKYMKSIGINTIIPLNITPWWKMQNDISFYIHETRTAHFENNVKQNLKSTTINSVNTFTLPWKLSADLSGDYKTASLLGITHYKASGTLNMGIKKELKNNSWLSLTVNDIFNSSKWRYNTVSRELNIRSYDLYDWKSTSVILTYSHNFGSKTVKAVSIKSNSETERSRVQ